MSADELNLVELPAIEQLKSLGWTYLEGEELSPETSAERNSFKDVILEQRLTQSIKRINDWISEENLRKVVRDLTRLHTSSLMEANQKVWETLVEYISVDQDLGKGRKGQTVKIIDFDQKTIQNLSGHSFDKALVFNEYELTMHNTIFDFFSTYNFKSNQTLKFNYISSIFCFFKTSYFSKASYIM